MVPYKIFFKSSVEKDIAGVPHERLSGILEKIEDLSETPVPHGSRKLSGTGSLYRIRAGEYRIVYEVCHDSRQITILSVRHRRIVYRGL